MSQSQATGPSPPPLTRTTGGHEGTGHRKIKRKKKHSSPMITTYKGKCKELKGHVYDMVPGKNRFDTFAKTTTEIGQYIARTVPSTAKWALVMRPENLSFPTIPEPAIPEDPTNLIEIEKWKATNKQYNDLMEKREENKRRAYAIVWGQCSPTLQDQVKASTNYATINDALALIELLGLIQKSMYTLGPPPRMRCIP
jgi:hypothetical protein